MKIASEKRSGRLRVSEGPAKGVIYFASGEGVWAELIMVFPDYEIIS